MNILSYGFDRLKLSVSEYRLNENILHDYEYFGNSHGFSFYGDQQLRVGVGTDYCVVEFMALWFMNNIYAMSDTWAAVESELNRLLSQWEKPRMSRIDVYVDIKTSEFTELSVKNYHGKSKIKEGRIGGESAETYYLFSKSRSWTIRKYDKSREISENMTAHRYSDEYSTDVKRIEVEYQKEYLKNLSERTFDNSIAYISKHLKETDIQELHFLADRLENEIGYGEVCYKAKSAGERNGRRLKDGIYKYLRILHEDFTSLTCGDDREFFAELARIAKKEVSIHV